MNIYQIITTIESALKAEGLNVTSDPYSDFKEYLCIEIPEPLALIESGDGADISLTGDKFPYKTQPEISITCMVNAHHRSYSEFKPEAIAFGKQVLDKVSRMDLHDLRIMSVKQRDGEFLVDSVKVSGVTLDIKFETPYNEND